MVSPFKFDAVKLRIVVAKCDHIPFLLDVAPLDRVLQILLEKANAKYLPRGREPFVAQIVILDGAHLEIRIALDKVADDRVVAVIGRQFAKAGASDGLAVVRAQIHARIDRINHPCAWEQIGLSPRRRVVGF